MQKPMIIKSKHGESGTKVADGLEMKAVNYGERERKRKAEGVCLVFGPIQISIFLTPTFLFQIKLSVRETDQNVQSLLKGH